MNKLSSDFELDRYGLHVRLVREEDAEFIVKLRTDDTLSKFVHKTDSDVQKQILWINEYKERERIGKELYFIFENEFNEPVGVERIYDICDNKFTSGSWLAKSDKVGTGVLCDIITREIAFELYPNSLNFFTISKTNKNVLRYAESYFPTLYSQDEENNHYYIGEGNFNKYKQKYLRMVKR